MSSGKRYLLPLAGALAAWAMAQTPKAFDAISIKPDRDGHGLDAGTQPGGRYTARNVSVEFLVTQAFGIKSNQLFGLPGRLRDDRYDIVARADTPVELSPEELRPLLQKMLVDRFALKFHGETRELPVYSLVVGKKGAKLRQHHDLVFSSGASLSVSSNGKRASMTGQKISMAGLASQLSQMAGRTVIDDTGLKGDFDFKLDWTPAEAIDNALPSLFAAVQDQLGLKLVPIRKSSVQVVVIESMERPSAN